MIQFLKQLFVKGSVDEFDQALTREKLIQSGRIIIIDDENPLLIEELRREGFAVDHEKAGRDTKNIENQIYDVAIIDYHGVGQWLGNSQGLDLLKYIKRISPRTRLVAYTSRSLSAGESEFFTLSHAVLPKDLGIGDSLALIETEVRKAYSKQHLFDALIAKLELKDDKEKEKIYAELRKSLSVDDGARFKNFIIKMMGKAAEKSVEIIIAHMFMQK